MSAQFAISTPVRGGRRQLLWAFTEHGAIQAANVLNSLRAVAMGVYVVRAFVKRRELLASTKGKRVAATVLTMHSGFREQPALIRFSEYYSAWVHLGSENSLREVPNDS